MYAGATAGATALVLASCSDGDNNPSLLDMGSGKGGILSYAYALEQLEAAFYAQVRTSAYYTAAGPPAAIKQVFDDLALHEAINRDSLKAALTADNITPLKDLNPTFRASTFPASTGYSRRPVRLRIPAWRLITGPVATSPTILTWGWQAKSCR